MTQMIIYDNIARNIEFLNRLLKLEQRWMNDHGDPWIDTVGGMFSGGKSNVPSSYAKEHPLTDLEADYADPLWPEISFFTYQERPLHVFEQMGFSYGWCAVFWCKVIYRSHHAVIAVLYDRTTFKWYGCGAYDIVDTRSLESILAGWRDSQNF